MCNKNSESAGTLSAQGWLNEATKHLTDPAQPATEKTRDKNLRRAIQCIIYACRQFKERQKEGYYAGRERRSPTFEAGPLNRGRRASDKLDEKTRVVLDDIAKEINEAALKDVGVIDGEYPGVQPFQLLLDTTAKLRKELEAEKEKTAKLERLIATTKPFRRLLDANQKLRDMLEAEKGRAAKLERTIAMGDDGHERRIKKTTKADFKKRFLDMVDIW